MFQPLLVTSPLQTARSAAGELQACHLLQFCTVFLVPLNSDAITHADNKHIWTTHCSLGSGGGVQSEQNILTT